MDKSILVVGSVALDTVKTPYGTGRNVLGGSATYFSVAASYFTRVKMVAVVGTDFPRKHVNFLGKRNIDLDGLTRTSGSTFRWKGFYGQNLNEAQTLDVRLNVFQDFSPELSASYRNTPYVFLANIDPDLQDRIISQAKSPKLIVSDTMNHWIEGKRKALLRVLRKVDILIINDGESRILTGYANPVKAGRKILKMGPSTAIIKRGEYGVICVSKLSGGVFTLPAFPLEKPKDTTGAGDSFAGGFMGNLARRNSLNAKVLRESVAYGNIIGSFVVEDFSLNRYRTLKRRDIEKRLNAFRKLMSF